MAPRPVLIMAGGTGGHVYPALAVAELLAAEGLPLLWLGTRQGLEARVVPQRGYRLLTILVSGLRRKGLGAWILAPLRVGLALLQSLLLLARHRPRLVLGMGGFASGPGGLAAWLLRIPLVIHEQNAVAGLTNRLLAPLAVRVLEAFPGTFPWRRRARHTGNPVRAEIAAVSPPAERLQGRSGMRLLVLGGSQGAESLNRIVPEAIAKAAPADFSIWHQAGDVFAAQTARRYAESGIEARVEPFIEAMHEAYAWSDLVICRAGALTVAELAVAGCAAILVPYPYAVDDHQSLNARYLSDAGAALVVPQPELRPEALAVLLTELYRQPGRRLEMARLARDLGRPEAARTVAGQCLEVLRGAA